MIPFAAIGFIAAWEAFDYVREQLRKTDLREAINAHALDETGVLQHERVDLGGAIISLSELRGAAGEHTRKYHVEVTDGRNRGYSSTQRYFYDYNRGKLSHWKPRQEFGWK